MKKLAKGKWVFLVCIPVLIFVFMFVGIIILLSTSSKIEGGVARQEWEKQGSFIDKNYGMEIIKEESNWDTDSIKLSTEDGWDFWFSCRNYGIDLGTKCVFEDENKMESYDEFGDLLYALNKRDIQDIAYNRGGRFIENNKYYAVVTFDSEEGKYSFAREVMDLDSMRPLKEVCNKGMDCTQFSPVFVTDQLDVSTWSWGTVSSIFEF